MKAASLYPGIMKYLPTLLPGQYLDIIKRGRMEDIPETDDDPQNEQKKTNVLSKLEELIKTNNVWKLGFNYVRFLLL